MADSNLKQKTAKGLLWGGMSNVLQQLLNAVFGIVIARLLSESDYGMVGMLTVFILVANSLQECGFTNALANRPSIEHRDYNAVFWFSTMMGLAMYALLFVCAPLVAQFYGEPELKPLLRYLSLSFVFSSTATAHNAYMFKRLMVKGKSVAQITALVVSGTLGMGMAYKGMAYWGLATQTVVYTFTYALMMWIFSPWRPTFSFDFGPIRQMIGFSSKMLITNIFMQLNNNIFSVLLGKLYTRCEVGLYSQANKWESMVHNSITSMITGVAQPVLRSVEGDDERQREVFRKLLRFTAFVSFPAMFGLALIAKEFIVVTVTDRWLGCVHMLQLLCLWGAFQPITMLYANMVISKGRSNVYMYNYVAIGIVQLTVLLLVHNLGIQAMIVAFVAVNVLWLLVWHSFVHRYIGLRLKHTLADIMPFAAIAAVTMAATYASTLWIGDMRLLLIARVVLAAAIYVAILRITNAAILKECVAYLTKKKKQQ